MASEILPFDRREITRDMHGLSRRWQNGHGFVESCNYKLNIFLNLNFMCICNCLEKVIYFLIGNKKDDQLVFIKI